MKYALNARCVLEITAERPSDEDLLMQWHQLGRPVFCFTLLSAADSRFRTSTGDETRSRRAPRFRVTDDFGNLVYPD